MSLCEYHRKIHAPDEYRIYTAHINCFYNNECLNPTTCPLWKKCPHNVTNLMCKHHEIVHTNDDYDVNVAHTYCIRHGHCHNPLQCPLFITCPCHIDNDHCVYHNKIHKRNDYYADVGHIGCISHGHCLRPISCPLYKTCPTNDDFYFFSEKNMEVLSDIKDLSLFDGTIVQINGWVHKLQTFNKHSFLILRDGKNKIQVFVTKSVLPDNITIESYIKITGEVKKLPEKAYSFQPYEIIAKEINIISMAKNDFSSRCPDTIGIEGQLNQRHLYLRNDKFSSITKLRDYLLRSIRNHFYDSDCTEIIPPCFVGNQCEGGATLFKVDHIGTPAYLTQSSQFYLEYAVPSVGDCFCIYPSFRAENSQTRRHLTEFLHAEAEWKNVFTMEEHVEKLRNMMIGILTHFLIYGKQLLIEMKRYDEVNNYLTMVKDSVIVSHQEAINYCREHNIYKEGNIHFNLLDDIPEAQERKMIDCMNKVVFLVRFPGHFKSFYMKPCDDATYVEGCDVEVPGVGEIIGSGIRVSEETLLIKKLKEEGLNEDDYKEYIDMRKYGHGQTSGMGLGVDRMLTWLLGMHSIREVVTFPRYPGRLTP